MALKYRLVTTADAKNGLSRYLDAVASNGETIFITRNGRPVAQLAPLDPELARSLAGAGAAIVGGPESEAVIRLGGAGREFRTSREHAEYLLQQITNRPAQAFQFNVPGGQVTIAPRAIETVTLPYNGPHRAHNTTKFAELVTMFDTRFRLTMSDYESLASNLVSGSPLFSFFAVANDGEVLDRMHYIPRESVNHVYMALD